MDPSLSTELVNHLFERPGNHFGGDLAAANIQRGLFERVVCLLTAVVPSGRDTGIATYNDFREYCGFKRAHKFSDLIGTIGNKTVRDLESIYEYVAP